MCFIMSFSCWNDMGRVVASWHAAQRPGHDFARHASDGCLRGGCRLGSVRTIGFGLGRPICPLWVGKSGNHHGIRWPTLGGMGLPAAPSSPFAKVPRVTGLTSGSGAGRLVAGTVGPSQLGSCLAFRLPAVCCDGLRGDWTSLPAPQMVGWRLMSAKQDTSWPCWAQRPLSSSSLQMLSYALTRGLGKTQM